MSKADKPQLLSTTSTATPLSSSVLSLDLLVQRTSPVVIRPFPAFLTQHEAKSVWHCENDPQAPATERRTCS